MESRVVITGAGVLSTLGDSPAELHAALCQGRSGVHPLTLFPTNGLGCHEAAEIQSFCPKKYLGNRNLRPLDRTARLVAAAAEMALVDSAWTAEAPNRREIGLVLGTMFCSAHTISEFDRRALVDGPEYASPMDFANTVINAASGQAAIWHGLCGLNSTIAAGAASGLQAIGHATELIRNGRAAVLLAGGAEELCFESFYGFYRAGMLCGSKNGTQKSAVPFHPRRSGFVLGEGAGLVVLEDAALASGRGARALAEILGYGNAYDCRGMNGERVACDGIAQAIRLALRDARMGVREIGCLSASANGSILGDEREATAVASVFGERTHTLPLTAIKSMLGEALGASGAFQTIALLEAMREGVLPGIRGLDQLDEGFPLKMASPRNREISLHSGLINSVGFDGNCCALVMARCDGSKSYETVS